MPNTKFMETLFEAVKAAYPAAYETEFNRLKADGKAVYGLLADETVGLSRRVANTNIPATAEEIIPMIVENPRLFEETQIVERMGTTSPMELVRLGMINEVAELMNSFVRDFDANRFDFVTADLIVEKVSTAMKSIRLTSSSTRILKSAELTALEYSLRDFRSAPALDTFETLLSDLQEQGFQDILRAAGLDVVAREIVELGAYASNHRKSVFNRSAA